MQDLTQAIRKCYGDPESIRKIAEDYNTTTANVKRILQDIRNARRIEREKSKKRLDTIL